MPQAVLIQTKIGNTTRIVALDLKVFVLERILKILRSKITMLQCALPADIAWRKIPSMECLTESGRNIRAIESAILDNKDKIMQEQSHFQLERS